MARKSKVETKQQWVARKAEAQFRTHWRTLRNRAVVQVMANNWIRFRALAISQADKLKKNASKKFGVIWDIEHMEHRHSPQTKPGRQ